MNDRIDYAALLLRIGLGTMFLAHGLLKVLVFTLPGTAAFFEQVGFPGWTAYIVIFAEIGGGVLLLAGVGVRLVSLALVSVLLGAVVVHFGSGWLFSNAQVNAAGSWHLSHDETYTSNAKLAECDSGKPYSPKPRIC